GSEIPERFERLLLLRADRRRSREAASLGKVLGAQQRAQVPGPHGILRREVVSLLSVGKLEQLARARELAAPGLDQMPAPQLDASPLASFVIEVRKPRPLPRFRREPIDAAQTGCGGDAE